MTQVLRLFVEKKPGFDVEAKHLLSEIQTQLGYRQITSLRLINRYDLSGITAEEYALARTTILSEPNVDDIYDETLPVDPEDRVFAMEYLPGQYDQRADSAAQCVQLLTQGDRPQVRTAKVVALKGALTDEQFVKIQAYCINPVESRLAAMDKPDTLDMALTDPAPIPDVPLTAMDDAAVAEYWKQMGFAMTVADLCFVRDYFQNEQHRDPTLTELKVIDTYWSDHCRHTTFLTRLDKITVTGGDLAPTLQRALEGYFAAREQVYAGRQPKPVTLMDMGTLGGKLIKARGGLDDLDESEEINACSIEVPVIIDGVEETWLVQFKNETHNHPTEIEPFGGAATCLGGAIRDPLSGRAYVYQAMRVTGSGDPRTPFERTLPGKLPQRAITTGAAHGYSSYGNQIGLATGQVVELYDEGYVAKRLEIGAVVGASPKANVVREQPVPGDVIVLLGGRTGRDGCGGATGSSKAHDASSIETCGAEVQKGNPPTERKLQRLFRDPAVSRLIKRCNDFGAGGVCVAIGELADGLTIDLDKVPKKYEGLDGTELAISESQERMAVVLDPQDVATFIAAAQAENLEATAVATVTAEPRLVMHWRDQQVVDISRAFLDTNGVTQVAEAQIVAPNRADDYRGQMPACLENLSLTEAFKANLGRLQVGSQKGLAERFDGSIGAGSVLMPFGGKYQLTPEEGMVAKIPLLTGSTDTATAMAYGYIPALARFSPFHGAVYAVVESLSKLAALGADPLKSRLTFQEYFERLYDKPERWGKPAAALLGALLAQDKMGTPAIGGKDSMSGSFQEMDVPPTLVSFAIVPTTASGTVSAAFTSPNLAVYRLSVPVDTDSLLPDWEALKANYRAVYSLAQRGALRAASVVHEGGMAAAIVRMGLGNRIGFTFDRTPSAQALFAAAAGDLILALDADTAAPKGAEYLGTTTQEPIIALDGKRLCLDELRDIYMNVLEDIFPNRAEADASVQVTVPPCTQRAHFSPVKVAKPRVLIPAFPGTNCEVDTARAFERAGAIPQIVIVNNLSSQGIEDTIDRLAQGVANSQIVMLPGGFSGGDEPDGSGKFIATTLRNPKIFEQLTKLLEARDGLMLGICNGFQALIKLGLLPYGRIGEVLPDDPTLSFNTLGRHISRLAYTKVASVKSPWLANCQVGDVHAVAFSHGEGRFVADEAHVRQLAENGQIAFQYVDEMGNPSMDITWNPNGSVCAIEGITSPDGRILGKMGHSERAGENLLKNIPGDKDQGLFAAGVDYFR